MFVPLSHQEPLASKITRSVAPDRSLLQEGCTTRPMEKTETYCHGWFSWSQVRVFIGLARWRVTGVAAWINKRLTTTFPRAVRRHAGTRRLWTAATAR